VRLRLPKDPKAPLLARAFVRNALCERHSRETRDEVELLVSELVTNAVVHGGSLVTMELDCEGPEGIAVSVSDSSPTWPVARHPDPLDEGGRGMELVELISDAWGVREPGIPTADGSGPAPTGLLPRQAQGKAVWFRLAG
jgi:anti-sigma regulatory factor (Ser/Thr protein kinase)